jgi:tRNA threonylcarbamoyladenosine biosynthesis protein TsaB
VGLSAAKGFSAAADVPLIAVSRLALLAASVPEAKEAVQVVLDAGRGEFYFGKYLGPHCLREQLIGEPDLNAVDLTTVVVCESRVAEALAKLVVRIVPEPLAGDALPLALERIRAGEFDDPGTLDANYLRRSDAEIFAKPSLEKTGR